LDKNVIDAEAEAVRRWMTPGNGVLKAEALLATVSLLSEGRVRECRDLLRRQTREGSHRALAWALRGLLVEPRGAGRRCLDRAARLKPAAGWPLAFRARWHRDGGDIPSALEDLGRALEREPAGWIHRLRATCLEQSGDLYGAIADLEAALKRGLDSPETHQSLGDCLLHQKRYADVAKAMTRALKRHPRTASLLSRRADALWLSGDLDGARRDLEACLRAEPHAVHFNDKLTRLAIFSGDRALASRLIRRWRRSTYPGERGLAARLAAAQMLRRGRLRRAAARFARAGDARGAMISQGLAWLQKNRRS
jgi:tetratricopeptide (TPR) repeat protein